MLLGAIFLGCVTYVAWRTFRAEKIDGKIEIRFCHYSLQPAVRRAFQEVFAEYERRRPDVRVVELPIPENAYPQLVRTQLVGRMAPEIVQFGHHFLGMSELQAQYFMQITGEVEEPNPYNAGTPLATTRWRDTFVDGLSSDEAYNAAEHQYYGISLQLATVRLHYNLSLLKEITGSTDIPETYEQFIGLCDRVNAYSRRAGTAITPLAGSRLSGMLALSTLFSAVNQALYFELSRDHSLELNADDYARSYLHGDWNFRTRSIRAGYSFAFLMNRYMRPGFLQMSQTDANFQFMQGQALMLLSFSNDGGSLLEQAPFPIKPGILPIPTRRHTEYGRYVLGPASEAGVRAVTTFGVTQGSAHSAIALDLLRFLGSAPGNAIFTRYSRFVPVIEGVPVPPESEIYRPRLSGYPGRFYATMFGRYAGDGLPAKHLHMLFGHQDGVEAYCDKMDELYATAMLADLVKGAEEDALTVRRQELGFWNKFPARMKTIPDGAAEEIYAHVFRQNAVEARMLQTRLLLHRWGARKEP